MDPAKLEAARLLEPVYRSLKDAKKLADVLDLILSAAEPYRTQVVELFAGSGNLRLSSPCNKGSPSKFRRSWQSH